MNWKPLYDKIIIELMTNQEVRSETGFTIIQDMNNSKYTIMEGKVIAVGEGRLLQNGEIVKPKVKPGDKVKLSKMQGESFTDNGKEYTIVSEMNILAYEEGE